MNTQRREALRYAINCRNVIQKEFEVDFKAKSSKRRVVYSKIIFSKIIDEKYPQTGQGLTNKAIDQEDLGKIASVDRSTVSYYLKKFDMNINYEDFSDMYKSIKGSLRGMYCPRKHVSSGEFYLNIAAVC